MLLLACLLAAAAAAPASYDQRQDGEFNVRADVQNIVLLVAYPSKLNLPDISLEDLLGSKNNAPQIQERADIRVLEAFVEPDTPYHVEIGESSDRAADGDGRAVAVVIPGRRRLEAESPSDRDEYKLLGATEDCGPDRERDPATLSCRARSQSVQPEPSPAQPEPAPAQPEPSPAQPEPAPAQPEPSPAEPEPAPAQPEPAPAQPEPSPAQPEFAAQQSPEVVPASS